MKRKKDLYRRTRRARRHPEKYWTRDDIRAARIEARRLMRLFDTTEREGATV